MKRLSIAALILSASPALAHDGMHMHPHGYEALIVSALVALGVAAIGLRRSR